MNSDIPIGALLKYIWSKRLRIALFTFVIAVIAIIWLLALPNKYTSQAVFMAEKSENEGGLSSVASSFGGIASLAGINLGSDNDAEVEAEYLLTSESFLLGVVRDYSYLPQVVAANNFDFEAQTLKFDSSIYNVNNDSWSIDGARKSRFGEYPADWFTVDKLREIVSVAKDKETKLLTLMVQHYSPTFAREFAEVILLEINGVMKERESQQIDRRLNFLNKQLEQEIPNEIKQSIYALLEQQLKQKMIVETSENFIFKIIEPPVTPEIKSSPLRMLAMILIIVVTAWSAIIYFLLKYVFLISSRN